MSMKLLLDEMEEFIREKIVKERWTHKRLSVYLQQRFPNMRGLSIASLSRFCCERDIHKTSRLTQTELDGLVATAVDEVGPVYGCRTMTGVLAAKGYRAGEQRIEQSLKLVSPLYCQARKNSVARSINPGIYRALFFGEKLHVDQNEKNVMFGMTHVCAVDRFSRKIVAFSTMPIKNNYIIYENVYRQAILKYGMWDQIRVDHGQEFILMLFIQEHLAEYRRNPSVSPHLQTTSTQNHVVERIWVEVNSRINYPIKALLIEMQESHQFNLQDESVKHCVSWFSIQISRVGVEIFVTAWNEHPIRGRGIPNILAIQNKYIDHPLIPSADEAGSLYEESGGSLTIFSKYGEDPLAGREDLMSTRMERFSEVWPSFENIYHNLVNDDGRFFRDALFFYIDLTMQLNAQL